MVLNEIYSYVATQLTKWENHRYVPAAVVRVVGIDNEDVDADDDADDRTQYDEDDDDDDDDGDDDDDDAGDANDRTDTQYQDALIAKLFAFQFVNSYASMAYIAFLQVGG
jgi:hypothetical protein